MDLWQILVLGVARLGLDADWDRMEHIANYDTLVRQMLGGPRRGERTPKYSAIRPQDNVALLDEELLQQINARIDRRGRREGKVDTYVLETDVHFPTDLNLLWDAGRKCVDLVAGLLSSGHRLRGASKSRRQLMPERTASHIVYRGGPNKEARESGGA